jgi:2-dehydropantoate 2-reductase
MRIIIVGIGAIGGTVAGALTRSGADVVAVARGRQLEAMRARGLTLRTPEETFTVDVPVVGHPGEIDFRPDDAILLTTKGQDTEGVLHDLRDAGVTDQPIFCLQNGVANEAKALRLFPNVHAVTVMMPALYLTPGEVAVHSLPKHGLFYLGRYPSGSDEADRAVAELLEAANIAVRVKEDPMAAKYGKLIMNLSNIIGAALGQGAGPQEIRDRVQAEARAVLAAAGIAWEDVGMDHPDRKANMNFTRVPGIENYGTSTMQSLERGTGSVETDWLNGEIAYLGRLHGVPVPVNAYLTGLGARMAREGLAAGSIPVEEMEAGISAQEA